MKALIAILIVTALPLGCLGQSTGLSTRVSIYGFHKSDRRSLFELFAQQSGLQIRIEGNALGVQDPDHPSYIGFFAVFQDIPIRYPLSWALHFSPDISAEVNNGVLVVRPSDVQQVLSPDLCAFAEPAGSWTNSFTPYAIITSQQDTMNRDVIQLFKFLCNRLGADSIVIDPALQIQHQTVSIVLDGRTVRDAMQTLLKETDARISFQGRVAFLTTSSEDTQQEHWTHTEKARKLNN